MLLGLLILGLLFRSFRGCLKWMLVLALIGWVCERHPAAAREVWGLLQSIEHRLDELIDGYEQSHDGSRAVAPDHAPLPVELSAGNSAGTLPSRGNNHQKVIEYTIRSYSSVQPSFNQP
jgi:hypothetical protein